tara:strand:- start:796 stop:1089 length:294 start_codon:yes stop_codon:yes gene_type:complete
MKKAPLQQGLSQPALILSLETTTPTISKKSFSTSQKPFNETELDMELPGIEEVIKQTDDVLFPLWRDLALLLACLKIAKENKLKLREQLHIWRPFDV